MTSTNYENSRLTSSKNPSHVQPLCSEPRGRTFALEVVAAQVIVTGILSLLGFLFSSQVSVAILWGGMICSITNIWFVIVAFRPRLGKPIGMMLAAFYMGEIGKFILTALLFLIAFKKVTLFKQSSYALILLLSYACVQSTAWLYPLARSKFIARLRR